MSQSVSFDRAASFYDQTRQLSPPVAAAITEAIMADLHAAAVNTLLEIGVGTGRMARPLMERGVDVIGVDISAKMLARLRVQLSGRHTRPLLAIADATRLPIRDHSLPRVLAVHVLHLVGSPRDAIAEVRRVLAPGGALLHQTYRDTEALAASGAWWDDLYRERGLGTRRRTSFSDLRTMLEESGATATVQDLIEEAVEYDPAALLTETRERIHSWTWRIPDQVFREALPAHESWFLEHYGDQPIAERHTYQLEAWRWD
jgi:ubiquinone/menaquinone biosynthesis C-methylase UbiE